MGTVSLIGTNHLYQLPLPLPLPYDQGHKPFRKMIAATCKQKGLKAIAEEMCIDGLKLYDVDESVCKQVADDLRLVHKYCNPSRQEYKALGLILNEEQYRFDGRVANKLQQQIEDEIRANHEIREHYWFKKLLKLGTWPVLFVCGADHTEPFRALLQDNSIIVHVLFTNWAPN